MGSDEELYQLAARVGQALQTRGWRVALAESCTGGWVAKLLTDIAGSSRWFERGYVSYSNAAKQQALGVAGETLVAFGAVSREVVEQMATGACRAAGADLALAISGVAGPEGGTPQKPVGLVWFALARRSGPGASEQRQFAGNRDAVRRQASAHALQLLIAAAAD